MPMSLCKFATHFPMSGFASLHSPVSVFSNSLKSPNTCYGCSIFLDRFKLILLRECRYFDKLISQHLKLNFNFKNIYLKDLGNSIFEKSARIDNVEYFGGDNPWKLRMHWDGFAVRTLRIRRRRGTSPIYRELQWRSWEIIHIKCMRDGHKSSRHGWLQTLLAALIL